VVNPDVADVDAHRSVFDVADHLCQCDEPLRGKSVGELDEDTRHGSVPRGATEITKSGRSCVQTVGHGRAIMDDQAGDLTCEMPLEPGDHVAPVARQDVDAAVEVNDWQYCRLRHEPQQPFELARTLGVELRTHSSLPEAQRRQPHQRIVTSDVPLEESADRDRDHLGHGDTLTERAGGGSAATR